MAEGLRDGIDVSLGFPPSKVCKRVPSYVRRQVDLDPGLLRQILQLRIDAGRLGVNLQPEEERVRVIEVWIEEREDEGRRGRVSRPVRAQDLSLLSPLE